MTPKATCASFRIMAPMISFGGLPWGGQALLEALAPRGSVQRHHGRHVQRAAQEGVTDLGQARLATHAAAGLV